MHWGTRKYVPIESEAVLDSGCTTHIFLLWFKMYWVSLQGWTTITEPVMQRITDAPAPPAAQRRVDPWAPAITIFFSRFPRSRSCLKGQRSWDKGGMPIPAYPSQVVHLPTQANVASISWTQQPAIIRFPRSRSYLLGQKFMDAKWYAHAILLGSILGIF